MQELLILKLIIQSHETNLLGELGSSISFSNDAASFDNRANAHYTRNLVGKEETAI